MASNPGKSIAAIAGACAIAAPLVVTYEGWRTKSYADPLGIVTACAGVTGVGIEAGKTYSEDACIEKTSIALIRHAAEINPCLPDTLTPETRAAFVSFAYNIGSSRFCASTASRKARGGDLRGACAEMSRWTLAGGKELPGLVRRRVAERALCEKGLA